MPALVAQVVVDLPLPHLDREFDYVVPEELAGAAGPHEVVPGTRVKVRFSGRDRDGFVVGVRAGVADDAGRRLVPLRRLVSPVVTLTPTVLALARAVAQRYAGTLTDVLRFAVPPRHARAEAGVLTALAKAAGADPAAGTASGDEPPPASAPESAASEPTASEPTTAPEPTDAELEGVTAWTQIPAGAAFLRRLAAHEGPRAVWNVVGGPQAWRSGLLAAAAATRRGGRGVLVVVPDVRDVDRLVPYLAEHLGEEVARLVAGDGPSVRARAHLRVLTGLARVVVGTRSAAWAPVVDLGLAVCWDDGDGNLAEQRSPYPHAAQVLAMRAEPERTALLLASPSRSVWSEHLVATGWAASLRAERTRIRELAPRVSAPDAVELERHGGAGLARIPTPAWEALRHGLQDGPVLVQTARVGYVPHLVCGRCRTPARCRECGGTLSLPQAGPPVCTSCAHVAGDWRCPECGGTGLRAVRVGSMRTAEELGRAFPQVPVVASDGQRGVVAAVDEHPRIVVATPGAEPEAEGGYAAAVLLDATLTGSLPGLGAAEEALRRWFAAAWLVRPATRGGRVVIVGGGAVTQSLVRWDPVTAAQRDLAERAELRFPPAARVITLTGTIDAVSDLLEELRLPDDASVLGPAPTSETDPDTGAEIVRALLQAPLATASVLSRAVKEAMGVRSAHRRTPSVRVVVDPRDL